MGERDVEAGAENDVILLFADWRIADVDVSKGVLPSESLVDFSDGAEIEGSAVFACVRHVRKEVKVLVKDGSLAELVHVGRRAEHVPGLLENDVYKSVYAILDEDYEVPVTEADQVVTAVSADEEMASLLDVATGTALLRIVRLSRSHELAVEWCSSVYRTDRYRLNTRVARAVE